VTAVNGYYRSKETARELLMAKIAADMETHYKGSVTNPSVYDSYTTQFQSGPNCEILFASTSAGTAGSATTVAITADSASTAVNCAATSAGVVTIKVPADSAFTITPATATAALVVAAVNADTGTTAHAATWITATLYPNESDGSGVVSNMSAKTLVNEIQVHQLKQGFLSAQIGKGVH
jgi:hypothetical protein